MSTSQTSVVKISGVIGGPIWQPGFVCAKHFSVSDDQYPFTCTINQSRQGNRPTIREMVDSLTMDGDFQNAMIADATVTVTRTLHTATGSIQRRRTYDIRQFSSVSDYLVKEDSGRYYEIIDAISGEEN